MRRWTSRVSPVSSGQSRYLPRRPAARSAAPVSPSISSRADVRRTVRSRPTSTARIGPAHDPLLEPSADGLDLGQLGHRRQGGDSEVVAGRLGRRLLGRLLRAAGPLAEIRPSMTTVAKNCLA